MDVEEQERVKNGDDYADLNFDTKEEIQCDGWAQYFLNITANYSQLRHDPQNVPWKWSKLLGAKFCQVPLSNNAEANC